MGREKKFWIACISIGALALISGAAGQSSNYPTRLTKEGRGIVRRPPPADFKRGVLAALPKHDPASNQNWQVDLRGYDVRGLDLSDRAADLGQADFDSLTKWPARLPQGFNPAGIMEVSKNPGLGVRALHQEGITGRGVGIAIIDQGLLVDHVEYKDRLRLYEEIHCGDVEAAMHGAAVASIAVGKTVGVAPGADLYFIAETHGTFNSGHQFDWDFSITAQAIDRILSIQRSLPATNRIRVISISVGWSPQQKGYTEVTAAVARAKKDGIFVVSSSVSQTYDGKLNFHGLGREPMADPDRADSYGPGSWWRDRFPIMTNMPETILVPMDSRATASPAGAHDYVFYRNGGWSWSIPYIAGLYALACQVRPDITPEVFWAKALETGDMVAVSLRRTPPAQEEIERILKKNFLEPLAQLKARIKPEDLEKNLAEGYNRMTGNKLATMSEAEFLAWGRRVAAGDSGPRPLKTIVNAVRLIEALKK